MKVSSTLIVNFVTKKTSIQPRNTLFYRQSTVNLEICINIYLNFDCQICHRKTAIQSRITLFYRQRTVKSRCLHHRCHQYWCKFRLLIFSLKNGLLILELSFICSSYSTFFLAWARKTLVYSGIGKKAPGAFCINIFYQAFWHVLESPIVFCKSFPSYWYIWQM